MDKLTQMRTFVTVVQTGSFTQAALSLSISSQLASKYVSALETALGVRLLARTTRRVHLTEAGERYLPKARHILDELTALEDELSGLQTHARGTLRISAPVSFAASQMGQLITDFQRQHPAISVDLQLNDRKVNIVEEGFDVALRVGTLEDSSLIARKITPITMVICASPDYLSRYGEPMEWDELKQHRMLRYSYTTTEPRLIADNEGALVCNNGDFLTQSAVAGAGIVIQPSFIVEGAIKRNALKAILTHCSPPPLGLYALYAHRTLMTSKLRAFIDFISDYYGNPPHWEQGLTEQAG